MGFFVFFSFLFLTAITLFFLIMVPCVTLAHLLAFLALYFPKICLRCGTFQCFTSEVSISILSLEVTKLSHRKATKSSKSQGLNCQNLVANLVLAIWPCLFCYSYLSLLGMFIESAPLASLPVLLDTPAVFLS